MNTDTTQPLFCIDVVFATGPDNDYKTVANRTDRESAISCAREYIDGAKAVRVRHYATGSGTPEVLQIKEAAGINGGTQAVVSLIKVAEVRKTFTTTGAVRYVCAFMACEGNWCVDRCQSQHTTFNAANKKLAKLVAKHGNRFAPSYIVSPNAVTGE